MSVYISREVREVQRLHRDLFTDEFGRLSVLQQVDAQAGRISKGHQSRDTAVAIHIKCWHPELVGHSVDRIMDSYFTLQDVRETIAREYAFGDWSDAQRRACEAPDPDFDAVLGGDVDVLHWLIERTPSLVHERSAFGHRSTLLPCCGANCVETYCQVVPDNRAELMQILLDAGADVNATAEMYGGGSTTLALLITSAHAVEAGVVDDVVRVLVNGGADRHES